MNLHLIYGGTLRSRLLGERLLGCDICRRWAVAAVQGTLHVPGRDAYGASKISIPLKGANWGSCSDPKHSLPTKLSSRHNALHLQPF